MTYQEFLNGTNTRHNDHNFRVFQKMEIVYMIGDMDKEKIYEFAKELVDSSKTPEEIELESRVKEEIKELKAELKRYKEDAKKYQEFFEIGNDTFWKSQRDYYKDCEKKSRARIKELEYIIKH